MKVFGQYRNLDKNCLDQTAASYMFKLEENPDKYIDILKGQMKKNMYNINSYNQNGICCQVFFLFQ